MAHSSDTAPGPTLDSASALMFRSSLVTGSIAENVSCAPLYDLLKGTAKCAYSLSYIISDEFQIIPEVKGLAKELGCTVPHSQPTWYDNRVLDFLTMSGAVSIAKDINSAIGTSIPVPKPSPPSLTCFLKDTAGNVALLECLSPGSVLRTYRGVFGGTPPVPVPEDSSATLSPQNTPACSGSSFTNIGR